MFIKLRMVASIFVGISKIEYKPDGGPGDNLCFKHYNATEVHKFSFVDRFSRNLVILVFTVARSFLVMPIHLFYFL